jgi:NAD(P)H-dependent FMN reductase
MIRGFVGSPNREGMTATIVREALAGAEEQNAEVELIYLSDYDLSDCLDCKGEVGDDHGTDIEDDFPRLSELMDTADAVVVGSPVYWSTITTCTRAFLSRKLRAEEGEGPSKGMPTVGILVAGGSGNGLVEAMKPMYLLFEKLRWHALDCFPTTRFNWDRALAFSRGAGKDLAALADKRRYLSDVEVWTHYNNLKYRNYDRIDERRLLAEIIVAALPEVGPHSMDTKGLMRKLDRVKSMLLNHQRDKAVPVLNELIERGTEVYEAVEREP